MTEKPTRIGNAIRFFASRVPGKGRPWLRLVVGTLLLPPLSVFVWFLVLPWPVALRWRNPAKTSFIEYRIQEAKRADVDFELRQAWVPLEEISSNLQRAVLAAEDDRFYLHQGIDWRALAEELNYQGDTTFSWRSTEDRGDLWEALSYLREHRSEIKGRSTLTQQLAKNLYFTPDRSFVRKVNEAVVAKRLELFLPKERILELYLNVVEWGPGIFGAEAASRTYFDRGARDLTLDQAAALAGTLPHPLTSNPAFRPSQMMWRRDLLLGRLRRPNPPSPEIAVPEPTDTVVFGVDTVSVDTLGQETQEPDSGVVVVDTLGVAVMSQRVQPATGVA